MQALSDAQQFLFEERQRLLLLQAENDELKLQEIQDRQRIQQLLAMTQPLEQTVTYKQGGAPSSVTAFPKASGAAGTAAAGAGRAGSPSRAAGRGAQQQQQQQGAAAAGGAGERVLRTVFLPTVDSDFLLLKIESLQAQLNEQVSAVLFGGWRQRQCSWWHHYQQQRRPQQIVQYVRAGAGVQARQRQQQWRQLLLQEAAPQAINSSSDCRHHAPCPSYTTLAANCSSTSAGLPCCVLPHNLHATVDVDLCRSSCMRSVWPQC